MPILTPEKLKKIIPPGKSHDKLRIALSHEFVELYRGDKDLKVGKLLARDYNCEIVHLGTDIASPADSRVFNTKNYPAEQLSPLPREYYLLLMKSHLVWHRKGNISLGGFFRWTPSIVSQLLRWKPDLIFENPYLTLSPRSYLTYIASRILKIPLVYLDCGDVLPGLKLKNRIVLPLEKRVVNHAAAVITYNKAGKQRFINKYQYPAEKIEIIPKPVDTNRFSPHADFGDFKSRHDLHGKFVVAYFGRLCANKGARYLLDAADIMRRRGTDRDIAFLFVGGNLEAEQACEFKNHLTSLRLENVRLTGMLANSEMPAAYAASDVAVFPDVTNLPGFSTVLAESMAAGLPVIIGIKGWESAVPVIDGRTGLIIDPANPTQIADKIELLNNNRKLAADLASNVRDFAVNEMDYDKVVEKYFNLFCHVIGRTPKLSKSDLMEHAKPR